MDDGSFERRLQCAVISGWWTILIGALLITVSWVLFLVASGSVSFGKFVSSLCGGMAFADVRLFWIIFIGAAKLMLFGGLLVVLFLTVWLKKLRGSAPPQ